MMIFTIKQLYTPIGRKVNSNPAENENIRLQQLEISLKKTLSLTNVINDLTTAIDTVTSKESAWADGLLQLSNIQSEYNKKISDTVGNITNLENRFGKLNSIVNYGRIATAKHGLEFKNLNDALDETIDNLVEYRGSLQKLLPFENKLAASATSNIGMWTKANTAAQSYFKISQGISAEAVDNLQLYAAGSNQSLHDIILGVDAIADKFSDSANKGEILNSVFTDLSQLAGSTRFVFGKYPAQLAIATMQARKFGLNMNDVLSIGRKFLNIEESINDELTLQVLTGTRLVDDQGRSLTNQLRQAIVFNKSADAVKITNQILEKNQDIFKSGNIFQLQQLAKTLGKSEDELQIMYEKMELQKQLASFAKKDGTANFWDNLTGKTDEAIEAYGKQIGASDDVINKLKSMRDSQTSKETPADKQLRLLTHWNENGLFVRFKKGGPSFETHMTDVRAVGGMMGKTVRASSFGKTTQNEELREAAGRSRLKTQASKQLLTGEKLVANTSTIGKILLSPIIQKLEKLVDEYGNTTETPPQAAETIKDGIIGINDGIIKFNDRDKLTVVASPYGTMNDRIADRAFGDPTTKNSSIDTSQIVSAIQQALGNINISVAVDPMAIDKEIKFRSNRLNNV